MTIRPLFTNNAATALVKAITPTDNVLQITAGTGNYFPQPTGGNYFYLTLIQINNPEVSEIVKCIDRIGDYLTVERGQEGTQPQIFNISDNVELRITAASLNLFAMGGGGGGTGAATQIAEFTATQGQTVFSLPFTYVPNQYNLAVFVNGSKQIADVNYSEASATTIAFFTGLNAGDLVEVIYNLPIAAGQVDATNIRYNEGGIGAVNSTVQKKLQQSVSVLDFGAIGNGITDDSVAFQNAINSLGTAGGTVLIPEGYFYLLSNSILVNSNITLKGPMSIVGSPNNNASYPYNLVTSIRLASTATITLNGGSGIDGCLIYRNGMSFPAANSSAFAGTAITSTKDDVFVINSMILGFSQAIYFNGSQRYIVDTVKIDCNAGVWSNAALDISYVNTVHCWPFTTVATGTTASSSRSGSAFYFSNTNDWTKVTNCFAYDYNIGFHVNSCNNMSFVNCSVDGTSVHTGSNAIYMEGDCHDTKFIGGVFGQSDMAANINLSVTNIYQYVEFIGCSLGSAITRVMYVQGGNVNITACEIFGAPQGITITNSNSIVMVGRSRFIDLSSGVDVNTVITNNLYIAQDNNFENVTVPVVNGTSRLISVASASPLIIPSTGNVFNITGTTNFSDIQYSWASRQITLIFTGILTITNSATMNIAGGTFTTASGSTLTLVNNGQVWFEIGRKV
jgi:hypothetical protein